MFRAPISPLERILSRNPARIILLSFLLAIILGTILLALPVSTRSGQSTPLGDAFFTATSATCVTGLAVYDTYLYWSPFGQGVILLLIQVGGLGLVTFATFFHLALGRKIGLRGLEVARESLSSDSFADIRLLVRDIVIITFGVEMVGALFLTMAFLPHYSFGSALVRGIFISVSAFCNAGFDLLGDRGAESSLISFANSPLILLTVSILIIIGGLGFVVLRDIARWHYTRQISLHTRVVLVMTLFLLLGGGITFSVLEWNNPETLGRLSLIHRPLGGFFQSVTVRTAGFTTLDQADLTDLSKLVAILLMFVGAAPAGTGGGIKVTTIALLAMTILSIMRGEEPVMCRRRVEPRAVYRALALFFLSLGVVALCSLLLHFAVAQQISVLDIVYEEVSAFATVGLSTGVTAQLGTPSRLVLIFSMFLGRVGPLSMSVSLAFKVKGRRNILPAGKILIG